MASETTYLRAILPSLPNDFAKKIRNLCASSESSEHILDTLIRFLSGAEYAPNSTPEVRTQWTEKQLVVTKILDGMTRRPSMDPKRPREDDSESESQATKRQRSSAEGSSAAAATEPEHPVFMLSSISVTSPVRKKVHITVHKSSLSFTNPTSKAVEATVPLPSLTRAFLLPTRGKSKPHWTIVLLSSDSSDRNKPTNASPSNPQVIFGLDALASPALSTTTYSTGEPIVATISKGSPTKPSILTFLSHLGIPVLEPTPDVFRSACVGATSGVSANEEGVPGVEAYRGAKQGSLWFMKEGVLWGESKPCEFWPVEDLIGKSEGVKVVSASGRTCTVILTRKETGAEGEENEDDGEDVGEEAHFGMVDSREKPGIDAWVRTYRHLFGKKMETQIGIGQVEDDSDDEDEDFELKSEDDDDGSVSSSSSSSRSSDGGSDGGSDDDAEESAEGEGSEEEELKEEHHPLMRPGAMPRMSRAVIDMVVGMVEDDMMGSTAAGEQADNDDEDLEEDELED